MANIYKSNYTGEQIDNSVGLTQENTATQGQVLTANGTGGASWQNASVGTEVVANPVLAGTEGDLTGLEVAGTKYKVPTGGSGGGTQLYKHTIEVPNIGNLIIISTQSTTIVDTTILYNVVLNSLSMILYYSEREAIYDVFFVAPISPDLPSFYVIVRDMIEELPIGTIGNDTVTPL